MACVSCETTESSNDAEGGYQDPYAGYGGGYPGASDYVQVTPAGESGGDAGGYQAGGAGTGGFGVSPAPTVPAYTPPPSYDSTPVSSARTYSVEKGDTLYRISKMHGVTVEAIMSANSLSSTTIHPGDVITIP